jgi:hypothetical protein
MDLLTETRINNGTDCSIPPRIDCSSAGPFNNAQMLLLSNLYEMHQKFLRQLEDRLVAWTNETRALNISDVLARNLCLFTVFQLTVGGLNVN